MDRSGSLPGNATTEPTTAIVEGQELGLGRPLEELAPAVSLDPDTSVVNEFGRVWGIPNLFVTDASVFPTFGGYDPTLTIQAVTWRAAKHIAATLT